MTLLIQNASSLHPTYVSHGVLFTMQPSVDRHEGRSIFRGTQRRPRELCDSGKHIFRHLNRYVAKPTCFVTCKNIQTINCVVYDFNKKKNTNKHVGSIILIIFIIFFYIPVRFELFQEIIIEACRVKG